MPQRRPIRPGVHDPTAGLGGAPPARSALALRLALAAFGLLVCTLGAVAAGLDAIWWFMGLLTLLAVVAAADLAVITHRMRRGDPPASGEADDPARGGTET
jgi:fatty acid desaturase